MAIENGPVEIVDFPINSMVIFHSYVTVYQRLSLATLYAKKNKETPCSNRKVSKTEELLAVHPG